MIDLLRSVVITSVLFTAVHVTANPVKKNPNFTQDKIYIFTSQKHLTNHYLVSQIPQEMPIVQEKDWIKKDIKLPWNQLALDKSSGSGEPVVFTKSYKFKVGFFSNHKERIHARWTQNTVEIVVMYGAGCSAIFGCESSAKYALSKQITVTINGRDYSLRTVDQNTYGLTPELKQAITQSAGSLNFKGDEKIKFEVKEEALPALKQLFAMQSSASPTSVISSPSNEPSPINQIDRPHPPRRFPRDISR